MRHDAPHRGRLKRPAWSDPRLLAGTLLIVISLVAVSMTVRAADATVAYYAATDALTPGTVLTEEHLATQDVLLAGEPYIPAPEAPLGKVVARTIGSGELIPKDALVDPAGAGVRPVAVVTAVPLADGIEPGSVVDVWITSDGEDPATVVIGEGLTVTAVDRGDGGLAQGSDTVHIAVPTDDVGGFIGAVTSGGDIAVVGLGAH